MADLVDNYVNLLKRKLSSSDTNDMEEAATQARREMEGYGLVLDAEKEKALEQAVKLVREELENRVRIIRPSVLASSARKQWYRGSPEGAFLLPSYLSMLADKWGPEAAESVRDSSRMVMEKLANPAESSSFPCKGLVVGHVQSGKTANMMAVIARAVDAGYNFVIVLAGMTDTLRHQTQARMEDDLVRLHPENWHPLTSSNSYDADGTLLESGEYRGQSGKRFATPGHSVANLAVMKKNKAPLKRLLQDLGHTPKSVRSKFRVLIIDDEADQASINAKGEDETSVINGLIRSILHSLHHVSFVGYTATPFANMLINPFPGKCHDREDCLDDLYPKDFIVALPRADGYFGTVELFGRDPVDAEDEGEDGLDFIRIIPDTDRKMLLPARQKDKESFLPLMPESLEQALLYFIMACASRHCRGHGNRHMSMLLHTSHLTVVHDKTRKLVQEWLGIVRQALRNNDARLLEKMKETWIREQQAVPPSMMPDCCVTFDDLLPALGEIAGDIRVVMENVLSTERLNFSGDARPWIVIGGNILARGLTLEGLMSSYFLRVSRQYDTLLQMGRWFGYRHGYEDLPRIWMTEGMRENFQRLALVEHEIREEIADYARHNATPMDFAVRIRVFPGLAVTARSKMRHIETSDRIPVGLTCMKYLTVTSIQASSSFDFLKNIFLCASKKPWSGRKRLGISSLGFSTRSSFFLATKGTCGAICMR